MLSSPYRWWFCGLMSTLPLLPLRLHTVAVIYFLPVGFYCPVLLSTSPGILGSHSSSPLCSGMASGINQSSFFFSSSSFFPPSEGMSQFTVWRQLSVLSQDKPVFVCLSRHLALAIQIYDLCSVKWQVIVFFCVSCFCLFSCCGQNSQCLHKQP